MTYMFILKCALKLVEEIILYYDARSKKHQISLQCSQKHATGSYCDSTESKEKESFAFLLCH